MSNLDEALHACIAKDDAKGVTALLAGGADPNAKNPAGDPPLHHAARRGEQDAQVAISMALLSAGASMEAVDINHNTPDMAATRKLMALEKQLAEQEPNGEEVGLLQLAVQDCRRLLQGLRNARSLETLAKLDPLVDVRTESGLSMLHVAAMTGEAVDLKRRLELGAYPGPGDQSGRPPLFYAAEAGHVVALSVLIDADPAWFGRKDLHGDTVLHCVAASGSIPCLDAVARKLRHPQLYAAGNDVWETPLHIAATAGSETFIRRMVELMEQRGVNILDQYNLAGHTPLIAVIVGSGDSANLTAAKALLECGADANKPQDDSGVSPLMWTAMAGEWEGCELLLRFGADINYYRKVDVMRRPQTALAYAVSRGHADTAGKLMQAGAGGTEEMKHLRAKVSVWEKGQERDAMQALLAAREQALRKPAPARDPEEPAPDGGA